MPEDILDLKDRISSEISPIELLAEHIYELTDKAGRAGKQPKDMYIELSFEDLTIMGNVLRTALEHINEAVSCKPKAKNS